jgi:lipoprotein-releasing system permease protein
VARIPIIIGIGARLLLPQRRRLVATIAGVGLCAAVAVASLSVISGLRAVYTGRLLDAGAHLTVTAGDARGRRSDLLLEVGTSTGAVDLGQTAERADRIRLRNVMTVVRSMERTLGDRLVVASPYLSTQVLATYGTNEGVLPIKGVMPDREARLADLAQSMTSGSLARLAASRYAVLLGRRASHELGADEGDRIRIVSMTGDIFNAQVVGVYDLGIESANRSAIVNLRLAQAIERALPSEASAIGLQLRNPADAAAMARRIERTTGRDVETWEETNPDALGAFRRHRVFLIAITGIAIAIGGLITAHAVRSSAAERRRDAASLATIGFSRGAVRMTYAAQGLVIGAGSAVVGTLLGAVMIAMLGALPAQSAMSALLIEADRIPVQWSALAFVLGCGGTLLAAIVGSVLPAAWASRLSVVDRRIGE